MSARWSNTSASWPNTSACWSNTSTRWPYHERQLAQHARQLAEHKRQLPLAAACRVCYIWPQPTLQLLPAGCCCSQVRIVLPPERCCVFFAAYVPHWVGARQHCDDLQEQQAAQAEESDLQ
jgi:hypothetical protein